MIRHFGFFLLRSPLLTFEEASSLSPADLLKGKSALGILARRPVEESSPELLADKTGKNSHVEAVLRRHLQRMSSRPVPFGLYAGYTLGKIGKETAFRPLAPDHWIIHSRVSGRELLLQMAGKSSGTTSSPAVLTNGDTARVFVREVRADGSTARSSSGVCDWRRI